MHVNMVTAMIIGIPCVLLVKVKLRCQSTLKWLQASLYLPAKIPGRWHAFTYHAVDSIPVGCVVIHFPTSFIPWGW